MRVPLLLFLVLVLCGRESPGATDSLVADAEARRLEAREKYLADDYEGCVATALAGLARLPEPAETETTVDPNATVRAGLLQWAGVGAEMLGDYATARPRLESALALYRSAGARREVAATLNSLSEVYARLGERGQQLAVLVEAHAIFEELGEVRGRAALANSLGNYYSEVGESAKALPFHEQSVALRRTMNDPAYLATGLENLGVTLREVGRDAEARPLYEEALAIYRADRDEEGLAGVLTNLGSLAGDENRFDDALACYREALGYDEAAGYRPGEAILLRNIGATLRRAGRVEEAVGWLDQAVAVADELDEPERIASARLERAGLREQRADPAGALVDLRAAMAAQQRQATAAREDALLDLQTRFETLQKERQIDQLQRVAAERELGLARSEAAREAAQQAQAVESARRRATVAVAVGTGLVALVLAGLFRAKFLAARKLAAQRAELARALGELRDTHAELKRLYARKSEWLGFAVHELRGPLFGIDGCCAEIEGGLVASPTATVSEIRAAAGRMRRELDAWLDAERREQEAIVLRREPDDLGRLAAEVVAVNQPAARAKELTLRHEGDGPAPAEVDPWRWREVVDNLVSNALKFSPRGRRVTVRTGATATRAWCRVEDEGPGVTAEDRARLFGAFARLSAQPTAGEVSTGLGLHGAKRLVDAHGGEITVEDRVGGGAVFVVTLPRTPGGGADA